MDTDARLLVSAINSNECAIRIYQWSEPTVTTGYFQQATEDIPPSLRHLPTVRRLTGGGAILHNHEITYSLTLTPDNPYRKNPSMLYRIVHAALIELLSECGCRSRLREPSLHANNIETTQQAAPHVSPKPQNAASNATPSDAAFLCFLRSDANDVVCDQPDGKTVKIIGSAQRRRKGAVLQHGSIMMLHSDIIPDVPGIIDLFPCFDRETFQSQILEKLANVIFGDPEQN